MSLTKAEIDVVKVLVKLVPVPEWGGEVYVRDLPGNELDALQSHAGKESDITYMYRVAAACICNEDGVLLYEDVADLLPKSAAPVKRCSEAAMDLMGLTEEGQEELAKNSEAILSESSGSD